MREEYTEAIRRAPQDQSAWVRWFRALYSKVYYVMFWKTGGDVQRGQDLTQEAMARFVQYRGYEKVRTDKEAVAYLIRIGLNVLAGEQPYASTLGHEVDNVVDSNETTRNTERYAELEQVIAALPDDDARLIRWIADGHSISEVADFLGLKYTTAASRVRRAKESAKKMHKNH